MLVNEAHEVGGCHLWPCYRLKCGIFSDFNVSTRDFNTLSEMIQFTF